MNAPSKVIEDEAYANGYKQALVDMKNIIDNYANKGITNFSFYWLMQLNDQLHSKIKNSIVQDQDDPMKYRTDIKGWKS